MFDLFYDEACQMLAGKGNAQDLCTDSVLSARAGESE